MGHEETDQTSKIKRLEHTLHSLKQKRDTLDALARHNLSAIRMSEDPDDELKAARDRYTERISRIESQIRKVRERIETLQRGDAPEKLPILVVDDEKNIRMTVSLALDSLGLPVHAAVNGEEALQKLAEEKYQLLLLDLKLPGIDGMEVLHEVRDKWPHIKVIIITAHGTIDTAVDAMKLGASDFIQKPFSPAEIRDLTARVIERDNIHSA